MVANTFVILTSQKRRCARLDIPGVEVTLPIYADRFIRRGLDRTATRLASAGIHGFRNSPPVRGGAAEDAQKGIVMQAQEHTTADCHCPSERRNRFDFTVDAERLVAYSEGDTAELTVREVLDMSGNQPAEEYSLVEFVGGQHHERIKHENLDELLLVKPHARFAALFKGCTPVS